MGEAVGVRRDGQRSYGHGEREFRMTTLAFMNEKGNHWRLIGRNITCSDYRFNSIALKAILRNTKGTGKEVWRAVRELLP